MKKEKLNKVIPLKDRTKSEVVVELPVKPAFGGLTVIERKELECIWNGKTNYGKHPMTYQRFLEAGLEIIIGCTNASQKSV